MKFAYYLVFALWYLLSLLPLRDYKFADRNSTISNWLCRKLWRVQGVSWTLRSKEDHDTALKEGWLSIFEGFRP